MNEVLKWATAGTPPQWGIFIMCLIAFLKFVLPWKQQEFDHHATYRKENKELMERVLKCERECEEHKKQLREEIFGLRKQHVQEQISFARAIIDSIPDSPHLQALLRVLENGQRSLESVHELKGPITDKGGVTNV